MTELKIENLRAVSLVPSWTETLIECGINIVGRTQSCTYPAEAVEDIPIVGTIKEVNWEKVKNSGADIVLLDKVENPLSFENECPLPTIVTNINSIESVSAALILLSERFKNQKLFNLAGRWQSLAAREPFALHDLNKFPGLIKWVRRPQQKIEKIYYMLWKDPWMSISKKTFTGSLLIKLGTEKYLDDFSENYPEVFLKDLVPGSTLLVLASSPYPFSEQTSELARLNYPSFIVDAECFSWFGIRTLIFLEIQAELFKKKRPFFKIS